MIYRDGYVHSNWSIL